MPTPSTPTGANEAPSDTPHETWSAPAPAAGVERAHLGFLAGSWQRCTTGEARYLTFSETDAGLEGELQRHLGPATLYTRLVVRAVDGHFELLETTDDRSHRFILVHQEEGSLTFEAAIPPLESVTLRVEQNRLMTSRRIEASETPITQEYTQQTDAACALPQ